MSHRGAHSDGGAFASWGDKPTVPPAAPGVPVEPSARPRTLLGLAAIAFGAVTAIAALIRIVEFHADGHATSYQAGEVVGGIAAGCVGVVLVVWGLRRVRSADPAPLFPNMSSRSRRAGMIAIVAVLALIVAGAIAGLAGNTGSQPGEPSWHSQYGIQTQAAFVAGCENSGQNASTCGCVFTHLSADYPTPAAFDTLDTSVREYEQTHNPSDIPATYVQAVEACRGA